ncbi:MAG: hypothetical protein HW390_1732 [Candidatus Brocadiaceae bacterium]|nr:hypothetical protein [Candidatus Brocadiaceae bacterium]
MNRSAGFQPAVFLVGTGFSQALFECTPGLETLKGIRVKLRNVKSDKLSLTVLVT